MFQIFDNYTRNAVTKAKMREISKNFCMWEGDKISFQNAGDLTGLTFLVK